MPSFWRYCHAEAGCFWVISDIPPRVLDVTASVQGQVRHPTEKCLGHLLLRLGTAGPARHQPAEQRGSQKDHGRDQEGQTR